MEEFLTMDPTAALIWLSGAGMGTWMLYFSNFIRNMKTDVYAREKAPLRFHVSKWIRGLVPEVLQLIVFLGSVVPPVLAMVLLEVLPAETLEAISAYYVPAAMVISAYFGGQIWFKITKNDGNGNG